MIGEFRSSLVYICKILKILPLISDVTITPVTSSSFDVSATIDTNGIDALVYIEAGLTTDYGYEVLVNEEPINGISLVTALLTL